MATARFLITLWLSNNRDCKVCYSIRRADQERAVLCAQRLLKRARLSCRYITPVYDSWTVQGFDENKLPRILATGGVDDAETGRTDELLREGNRKAKSKVARSKDPNKAAHPEVGLRGWDREDLFRRANTRSAGTRKAKELTPFQAKMASALERARQELAEKKKGA